MDSHERDVSEVAEAAYVFAFPLVLASRAMTAPNRLFERGGPPGTRRISGWLDLGPEPVVLSVPEIRGRYHVIWLHDAWNTAYACVGTRTTGSEPRAFAVLGPGCRVEHLRPPLRPIAATTRIARVTGCIEAAGAHDELLAGIRTEALSRWTGGADGGPPPGAPGEEPERPDPVAEVERLDASTFFAEALRLSRDNPPEPPDRAGLDGLCRLLGGGDVAWERLDGRMRGALEAGLRRGRDAVRAAGAQPPGEAVGRWRVSYELGRYGTDYLRRAATAARAGFDTDPATDELSAWLDTDSEGRPLTGRDRYVLRFGAGASPPVHAFWSLTTGAGWTGDLRGLTADPDGSLAIHIQHGAPRHARPINWLPAPAGPFSVLLRLHWPREEALRRLWTPPAATRIAS